MGFGIRSAITSGFCDRRNGGPRDQFARQQPEPLMSALGHDRSFGDVGSMSGLPESGHDWAVCEYTNRARGGNPAGRLRGSRNKLSEEVICALLRAQLISKLLFARQPA